MMDTPLRFCLCTTFYPPFSSDADGVFIHTLANALASQGHLVTVVHSPATFEKLKKRRIDAPYSDHANVTVRPVSVPLGRLGLLALHQTGHPAGLKGQLEEIMQGPFDVIHFHNVSLLGGPAVYALGQSKVRIAGLNDHWLVCPMHLLWKYTGDVCDSPQCITCCIRQGRPPQWWRYGNLLPRMAAAVDLFLGPSLFTIRKHRERGFDRPMVHLPPMQARPPSARAEDSGKDAGAKQPRRPYFLCTGRLEVYKGFQDVIPLFREFPDHDLVICGEGSFRESLLKLAAGQPNVRVIGSLSPNDLHTLCRGAVATLVPTRSLQTFCHATAESFAAGTPVIAFRRSAVEEIVSSLGGGVLYDQPNQLRAAIKLMIDHGPARHELQAQARAAYQNEFSVEACLKRYLLVVNELLSRKEQGAPLFPAGPPPGRLTECFAGRPLERG